MVKRYLKALGVKQRIEVVPTGIPEQKAASSDLKVDIGKQKADLRKKLGLPIEGKILLFSGRLSAEKNIPFLLQAFPKILAGVKDIYLVLVGGGPKEQEYRRLSCKRIIFAGQIKHPEIYESYRAADLFVYASLTETQGLVLSEAKANGLPIVALFAGGLTDVVKNDLDGYLVARNEGAFVQRAVQLLRDDGLRQVMGEKARLDARERFSSIAVAKRMETLYNSLIKRGDH
jgi:glycosyltransferase involved in cell wall biosynthesis